MKKKFLSVFIASFLAFGYYSQQLNQITFFDGFNDPSQLKSFSKLGNDLIFIRNRNYQSPPTYEIYKSDGSQNGTFLFYTLPTNHNYAEDRFTEANNLLFFRTTAYFSGASNCFLWKTNGFGISTQMIGEFSTKTFCSNLCELDGKIYFLTKYLDPVWGNLTYELWQSDGTANGTIVIKDWINSSNFNPSTNNHDLRKFNNRIYFSGFESDGSSNGTVFTGFILPEMGCVYNGLIYYSGSDGKIWKSDGTTAGTIQAIDFPSSNYFFEFNGWLYFAGGQSGAGQTGIELCKTDGTLANTVLIKDIYLGFNSSIPNEFITSNGMLHFWANDGIHGKELWKTDGTTSGTTLVKDADLDYVSQKIIHNNNLFFLEHKYNSHQLWKSDGTETNTLIIQAADSSIFYSLIDINCKLFVCFADVQWSNDNYQQNPNLWSLVENCQSAETIEIEENNFLRVSPNPTSDKISIKMNDTFIKQKYFIYDQFGRIILKSRFDAIENEVDLSEFQSGIYFLKVEGDKETIKIVKN